MAYCLIETIAYILFSGCNMTRYRLMEDFSYYSMEDIACLSEDSVYY